MVSIFGFINNLQLIGYKLFDLNIGLVLVYGDPGCCCHLHKFTRYRVIRAAMYYQFDKGFACNFQFYQLNFGKGKQSAPSHWMHYQE
jgi:hypothetical protein